MPIKQLYMTPSAYYWIIASAIALLLFIIARIIKKHGKRLEWIGWLSIPLAAALLIMVLLGIRSCRNDKSSNQPVAASSTLPRG